MYTYIIHYSKNKDLGKELEERFPNAHILKEYDREDIFVPWIKYITKSNQELGMVSCNIKHFEALKHMVDNDIEEAFIFEDDVVLRKDWEILFTENKKKYFHNEMYIKMGCLHKYNIYNFKDITRVGNNGGTEAQYVTKKFAQIMLKNIRMDNTIDLIHQGCLRSASIPFIPIATQTSIITRNDDDGHVSDIKPVPWREYVQNYYSGNTLFNYYELVEKFDIFLKRKKEIEDAFFNRYNKRVDIKRIDYIYNNEF
jgi:GR25 family glycosyltransferase involved in LPS biosynthesis